MHKIIVHLILLHAFCTFLLVSGLKVHKSVITNYLPSDNASTDLWENHGFSKSSNKTESESFFIASEKANLQTTLLNYEHSMLVIKFSFIIISKDNATAINITDPKSTSTVAPAIISTTSTLKPKITTLNATAILLPKVAYISDGNESDKPEQTSPEETEGEAPTISPPLPTLEDTKSDSYNKVSPSEYATSSDQSKVPEHVFKIPVDKSSFDYNTMQNDYVTEDQVEAVSGIPVSGKSSETIGALVTRKRRALDRDEIRQVHNIVSMATKDKSTGPMSNIPTVPIFATGSNGSLLSMAIPMPISVPVAVPAVLKLDGNNSHLVNAETEDDDHDHMSYKTWRASVDKTFRPTGFYLMIDDQIVFDNWMGIWQKPNILGKLIQKSHKEMQWNETEVLIQWEKPPNRNLKVSFEWDPIDSKLLMLDEVSVSTYLSKTDELSKNIKGQHLSDDKNTLYIVVKHDEGTVNDSSNPIVIPIQSDRRRNAEKKADDESWVSTPLIVAIVVGILSLAILVVIVHRKIKESRRRGNIC